MSIKLRKYTEMMWIMGVRGGFLIFSHVASLYMFRMRLLFKFGGELLRIEHTKTA